jgi:hypothetical protein
VIPKVQSPSLLKENNRDYTRNRRTTDSGLWPDQALKAVQTQRSFRDTLSLTDYATLVAYLEGYVNGYEIGRESGYTDGCDIGYENGYEAGYESCRLDNMSV